MPQSTVARILALAPNHWHDQWMNRQYLLSRLGRRHSVLYSRGPWKIWDRSGEEYRNSPMFGRFDPADNVLVDRPGRVPLRVPTVPSLDRIATKVAVRRWQQQLDRMGSGPRVLWIFHPRFGYLADHLQFERLVYHAYDLYSHTSDWTPQSAEGQRRLLARADLIVCSSDRIALELHEVSGKPVHVVPNGVDFERFAAACSAAQPDDFAAIPRPRIGYIGSLNQKVDFPLLESLSAERPDWHFVLAGRTVGLGEAETVRFNDLVGRPNVHFLGQKSTAEIAGYTAGLDVGLLCYRTSGAWTEGIYPLKLHEYLACGLPVVSSDFPAVRDFPQVVRIARDPQDWQRRIEESLAGNGPDTVAERVAIARANSWDQRAAHLDELLVAMLDRPASPAQARAS
jgi:glycosyltransferase involved in cell wall biosynthesis